MKTFDVAPKILNLLHFLPKPQRNISMALAEYLLHVNSQPKVSKMLWKEGCIDEHLPGLVNGGCSVCATFYEETRRPLNTNPNHAQ